MKKAPLLIVSLIALLLALFSGAGIVLTSPLRAPQLEGRIAYAAGGHIWIWRNGPTQLTSANERDGSPALSPDGSSVAFIRYDDSFSDLLVVSSDGGPAQFLTNYRPTDETGTKAYVDEAIWALSPTWAPNGNQLAFLSDNGTDAPVLWAMSYGGGDEHRVQTDPPAPPLERPAWSPNGDEIAATSYGSGKQELWVLDLNSNTWRELATPGGGAYDPAWSPDGRWIAYTIRDGASHDIWVVPADGSADPVKVTSSGHARGAAWSPSGDKIAFLAEKDQHFEIFVVGISTAAGVATPGATEQVTENVNADAASGLSWSK